MPAGKPAIQSNGLLYTLITFVALFLVGAVCAIIFYVKAEDYKAQLATVKGDIRDIATEKERRELIKIVGKNAQGKTAVGTLAGYVDQLVEIITGQLAPEATSAVKVNNTKLKLNEMAELFTEDGPAVYGPNNIDLIQTIVQLKTNMAAADKTAGDMELMLSDLQDEFDLAIEGFSEEEQKLLDEMNDIQAQADELLAQYEELDAQMQGSLDDQVEAYKERVARTDDKLKKKNLELLNTKTELEKSSDALGTALAMLESFKPRPDIEVAAFEPDACVMSIDNETNTVILDIGKESKAYRGLTFSIYDKSSPIPQDGKGKAEVEIISAGTGVSAARINCSDIRQPIVQGDIAANLVWNCQTSNKIIVVGEFDFNLNGKIDEDGLEKVTNLIERWGGTVEDVVTVNTDFVILGEEIKVPAKPTYDQIEINPAVEDRYLEKLQARDNYQEVLKRANQLKIPVFNQTRFMYLIGYEARAAKGGPL